MRRLIFVLIVLGSVTTGLGAMCDGANRECSAQNDCPLDHVCTQDGTCIPFALPDAGPERDAGVLQDAGSSGGGGGGGGGDPSPDDRIDTDAPITMFVPGPTDTVAYLAQGANAASGFDRVDTFNLDDGELTGTYRDFRNGGPSCYLDTIQSFSTASVPLPAGDELWYSCANGVQVEQSEGGFLQRLPMTDVKAEHALLVPSTDGTGSGADARLLLAGRGDRQLKVVLFNSDLDALGLVRNVQTVGVSFTAIAGLYLLTIDDPTVGDMVLVFDRSSPPRLVPLQRPPRGESFVGPGNFVGTDLGVLVLPEDTHYAYFREDIGIRDLTAVGNINDNDRDIANVVVLMPTVGRGTVRFLRYESEFASPGSSAFLDLDLQANDAARAPLPPATDRIILLVGTDGDDLTFTYAPTRSSHVWRFPLHRNRNDNRLSDVIRARFNGPDVPIGVMPAPSESSSVWVAYRNRQSVELLPFIPPF